MRCQPGRLRRTRPTSHERPINSINGYIALPSTRTTTKRQRFLDSSLSPNAHRPIITTRCKHMRIAWIPRHAIHRICVSRPFGNQLSTMTPPQIDMCILTTAGHKAFVDTTKTTSNDKAFLFHANIPLYEHTSRQVPLMNFWFRVGFTRHINQKRLSTIRFR